MAVAFSILGCGQHKSEDNPKEVLPPQNIEKSHRSETTKSGSGIKIPKGALGKIFLLRAVMKGGASTPVWEDMKPMIVMFERSEDELAMFDRDTFAVYSVLDTNRLVTTFQIVDESDTEITFDWGKGLKIVPRLFFTITSKMRNQIRLFNINRV